MPKDSNYIGGSVGSVIVDYAYAREGDMGEIHYFDTDFNEIGVFSESSDASYLITRDFSENGSVVGFTEYFREHDGSIRIDTTMYEKGERDTVIETKSIEISNEDGTDKSEDKTFYVCDIESGDVYEMTTEQYNDFMESGEISGNEVEDYDVKNDLLSIVEDDSIDTKEMEHYEIDTDKEIDNGVESIEEEKPEDNPDIYDGPSDIEHTFSFSYPTNDTDTIIKFTPDNIDYDSEKHTFNYYKDDKLVATLDTSKLEEREFKTEIYNYDKNGDLQEKTIITEKDGVVSEFKDVSYEKNIDGGIKEITTEITYVDADTVIEYNVEREYEYNPDTDQIDVIARDSDGHEDAYSLDSSAENYNDISDMLSEDMIGNDNDEYVDSDNDPDMFDERDDMDKQEDPEDNMDNEDDKEDKEEREEEKEKEYDNDDDDGDRDY